MIEITEPERPLLIVLVGVAASGKTTFANEFLKPWLTAQEREAVIISKDKKRNAATEEQGITFDAFQQSREKTVGLEQELKSDIDQAAQDNKDIIIDRVNSTAKYRRVTMAAVPEHYKKIAVVFEPRDLETLFMRSLARDSAKIKEGKPPYLIPVRAIKKKLDQLQLPTKEEGFDEIYTVSFEPKTTPAPGVSAQEIKGNTPTQQIAQN